MRLFLPCLPPTTTAQQKRQVTTSAGPRFFANKKGEEAAATFDALLIEHTPPKPLAGGIIASVHVVWPYLRSDLALKADRQRADFVPHLGLPDLDNWIKLLFDRLKRLRMIEDDRRIWRMSEVEKLRGPAEYVGIWLGLYESSGSLGPAAFEGFVSETLAERGEL